MKKEAQLTIDDKVISIYWFDRLKEQNYIDCLKAFTKSLTSKEKLQNIYLILFESTTVDDFKSNVVTRLALEHLGAINDTLVAINLGKAKKKKDNVPLIQLLLLLTNSNDVTLSNTQELVDLAKNIKELINVC